MNHACILFCYNNYDHIVRCYESLASYNIDFFVLENISTNSNSIERYFKTKNIKGYVQFQTNISNNAIPIYFRDFHHIFVNYDYLTFTDCDIEVENAQKTFLEIIKNLNMVGVGMSCVDLCMENFPTHIPGSDSWIPYPKKITDDFIVCPTGGHLMTLKRDNFDVFFNTDPFIDGMLLSKIEHRQLLWVKTKINKAKHLTWDLYKEDNSYYQFKKNNPEIWNHSRVCRYIKII